MQYFEDLTIGKRVSFEQQYLVTEEEIIEVGKRWDPQVFHTDPVAATDSFFGGLVASSAHIFSIYVCIGSDDIDKEKQFAAVSALGFNNLQWHSPVRPNDVLRQYYTVTSLRESKSRPELGIVASEALVYNQNNESVFSLENTCLIKKRPQ